MKKKIFIGIGVIFGILLIIFIYGTFINPPSPGTKAEYSYDGLDIKVTYSQPSKRGRLIFGKEEDKALQPYGKYWRLGANATTDISFSKNVLFAGKPVNAGTYRMYAVPGPETFQISLNSESGVFFGVAEPEYSKDILKVDLPVEKTDETEKFVITFNNDSTGVKMNFIWDTTKITVPIKAQ
jgi:hypothetical protein